MSWEPSYPTQVIQLLFIQASVLSFRIYQLCKKPDQRMLNWITQESSEQLGSSPFIVLLDLALPPPGHQTVNVSLHTIAVAAWSGHCSSVFVNGFFCLQKGKKTTREANETPTVLHLRNPVFSDHTLPHLFDGVCLTTRGSVLAHSQIALCVHP